jgi:hypothetical protein
MLSSPSWFCRLQGGLLNQLSLVIAVVGPRLDKLRDQAVALLLMVMTNPLVPVDTDALHSLVADVGKPSEAIH